MALITCPECSKQVSDAAESCPHCGHPIAKKAAAARAADKKAKDQKAGGGCLILIIGFFVVMYLIGSNDKKTDTAATPASTQTAQDDSAKKETDAACRQNLHCYIQDKFVGAGIWCKDPISKLAKYDMRWTDGWLEMKFDRASWLDKSKGTLTFYGDKAQFQNGFGAYVNVKYECDYDPNGKDGSQVLDVRVNQPD